MKTELTYAAGFVRVCVVSRVAEAGGERVGPLSETGTVLGAHQVPLRVGTGVGHTAAGYGHGLSRRLGSERLGVESQVSDFRRAENRINLDFTDANAEPLVGEADFEGGRVHCDGEDLGIRGEGRAGGLDRAPVGGPNWDIKGNHFVQQQNLSVQLVLVAVG